MNVKDSGKSSLQGRYRPACWTTPLRIPGLLARLSSDEYRAPAYSGRDYQALDVLQRAATETARRLGQTLAAYYSSRLGTAASLHAINAAAGTPFYRVDAATTIDREQANECFQGRDLVIDVQTHFVANHRTGLAGAKGVHHFIRQVAPELFSGLNLDTDLSLGEYLRCIFLQSETSLAVLTSAPGTEETNILSNAEIAGTRELVDRLAGTGRLLHHAIVHPNLPGELERMSGIVARCRPNGFKEVPQRQGERDTGEQQFRDGIEQLGTDRLIQSLRDAGIPPGANVYAELGSTWYILIKRPEEAVHVLGKLRNIRSAMGIRP